MRITVLSVLTLALAAFTSCTMQQNLTTPEPEALDTTPGTVVAVIDGDTIDVLTDTGKERVRIIGIDTPEIDREGAADECYAQEARDLLNDMVYQKPVELIADPTQEDRDRYDRALRHVTIDGQSVAVTLISDGAGYEYTYDKPYTGQAQHISAQDEATNALRGLWGSC